MFNLWWDVFYMRIDYFYDGLKYKWIKIVKCVSVFRFCLGIKGKIIGVIE